MLSDFAKLHESLHNIFFITMALFSNAAHDHSVILIELYLRSLQTESLGCNALGAARVSAAELYTTPSNRDVHLIASIALRGLWTA